MDALSAAFPSTDIDSLLITQSVSSFGGEIRGEDTFDWCCRCYHKITVAFNQINGKSFILE